MVLFLAPWSNTSKLATGFTPYVICGMNMNNPRSIFMGVVVLLWAAAAGADTLELKNGTVLQGKYLGGTAETVRFETSAGMQIIEFAQIKNMSVSQAAAPAAAPAPAPAAPVATTVTIPAGTVLMVQMRDSVSSQSATGANFSTVLQHNLVVNGVVAVKAGTVVHGKVQSASQAKRARGQSTLDVRLAQMVVNGNPVPISTGSYIQQGENETRKTVAAAGVGAIIGNNANGGGRSGEGAAWGVAAASLRPGETLTIPPGAIVEFALSAPVTVSVSR